MDKEELILDRLGVMHEEMQGMRNSITQIAEAITRLAVLEEKHQGVSAVVTRLSESLETARIDIAQLKLDQAVREAKIQGAAWVGRGVWAFAGGLAALVVPLLFRLFGG